MRRRIASALIEACFEDRPTVLAAAVARGFADRLCGELEAVAARGDLAAWIAATCGVLPLDRNVASMLERARSIVEPLLGETDRGHAVLLEADRSIRASLTAHELDRSALAHEDDLDATIAAFIVRLDDIDAISAEHSRAVALWCRRLAVAMNFTPRDVVFASRCGLLHDIGKAGTPREILLAPHALNDAEWAIMRDHTVGGARMLAEVDRLHPFVPAARSHHERLDGKGYPDKLSARQISPIIRIVTVADSFNAMIGRRPYRLPLSPAFALEQLVEHSDSQFDPDVARALVLIVENP